MCWVARPNEKTVILYYMLTIFFLSTGLTVLEIIFVIIKWSCKFHKAYEKRPGEFFILYSGKPLPKFRKNINHGQSNKNLVGKYDSFSLNFFKFNSLVP